MKNLNSSKKTPKSALRPLGKAELIAIALGGMIGGGIFSILGVSVTMVGKATPIAIAIGGILAFFAAYSYAKLAVYYKDEGATYSFFKKTFMQHKKSTAAIGWLIVFGYISTLALYAYTFSTYFSSLFGFTEVWQTKVVAIGVLVFFAIVNYISVNGMGKIEDLLVYTKILILLTISGLFINKGDFSSFLSTLSSFEIRSSSLIIVAALTFVAFEGFQLVIHAYEESVDPDKNVPQAIYWAIFLAALIYVVLSIGAILTIPENILIRDKEFALAAGATEILGPIGFSIVVVGALLATSSAINGTLFGASRLMAVIAEDKVFPKILCHRRKGHIPDYAIFLMAFFAIIFILLGALQSIIEFGSITFI
ncbi:MAG: amino acid permease, partial [Bdellovibrionales bacterium]|nr:amino acid permease [Bdellovibrionales bacterium]